MMTEAGKAGRLAGKIALITGAAAGIGRASAVRFAAEGAAVALADIDGPRVQQLADSLRESGASCLALPMDVTDEASVAAAFERLHAEYGRLDVLMNNAGGSSMNDRNVVDIEIEEFWRAIRVDLFGTFVCCRHAIPLMRLAGGGSIINMGSISAHRGLVGRDAYTAAKGGVTALSRSLAVEFAAEGIRSNIIAPGAVSSERMERFIREDERVRNAVSRHLLGLPAPEEVAATAVFLASDESAHMTGAVLALDGGRSAAA
ncbi:SDR family NAD(P)-dependent oxidoreductase [Variovorax sp. J22P168]|uniref:SDR family NAD(P)-dependent oxidoreductase n=1 Tax=Variovorax jilinensis TaxID=3053513 RepID=UPI002576FAD4|nr:SDR family NAD(P)-dependent oxidoreductase [Variovorax sp. J22P168]MDM0014798.1 SDR family NAD(P)-dependent oxidoreductase [Variovorax sp. J22P168]